MTDELLVISTGRHGRLAQILSYALDGVACQMVTPGGAALPPMQNRRLVFAVSLGVLGLEEGFCRLVRQLRAAPDLLRGSVAVHQQDGEGELYTKQAAHMLVLAANQAGCTFPGKPLVEGTGSLHNLDVLSRRMNLPHMDVYRETARALIRRLTEFLPPRTERPRILTLHASDRSTSNTLALCGRLQELLAEDCDFEEISLRNGTVHDCRGCSYTVCSHYAQQNSCFYGGSIVDDVYPALIRCNALMLLCPNYNDSVSANIVAFINRLTSLQLFHSLQNKYLYAIIVSGYSGSDLVAQQVLGALCLNKAFILPPHFCLMQTANDPGAALQSPGITQRLSRFADQIREAAVCR